MKKLLFLLALVTSFAFVNTAKAQYTGTKTFTLQAGDTLNNADSVFRPFQNTTAIASMGIQVNVKTITGTLAGKVYLYGSNNARDYSVVDSATYVTTAPAGTIFGGASTYTNVAKMTEGVSPYQYYIIMAVSSGTVSASTQFLLTTRKYYPY